MNAPRMSDRFASTFRAALIDHVAHQQNPRRKRRMFLGATAALSLILGGTVAAAASGLFALPGATEVTAAGAVRSETFTGTGALELGPRPESANAVSIAFTCLSPGTFAFSAGISVSCDEADVASNLTTYLLPLDSIDGSAVRITTSEEAVWTLTAGYVTAAVTDWAVNESGRTYGVSNDRGHPDLIAVIATNGQQGYVDRSDLEDADGTTAAKNFTSPEDALEWQEKHGGRTQMIPVYESDGVTVIGEFQVG